MAENIKDTEEGTLSREIGRILSLQRKHRFELHNTSAKVRITKLKRLEKYILTHRSEIKQALYNDLKKPAPEADLSEIYTTLMEIRHCCKHLKSWMFPEHVSAPLSISTTKSYIKYESKGVVLIISPWNFPFALTVAPLISAIAAGNCVVLKPSEMTPHTSDFMQKMVSDIFSENEVVLFQGDKEVARELLKNRFDHIFFTGSPRVGRIVMKAAAEHLTSVTLELGGKSPAIVDSTANVDDAVDKLVWGKFINAGQTCIAPDYLLVPETLEQDILQKLTSALEKTYRQEIVKGKQSENYTGIVNSKHAERLKMLLDDAVKAGSELVTSGYFDEEEPFISPVILRNVDDHMAIMQEEIFGPILPVLTYTSRQEIINFINSRPNPLALYIFSRDTKFNDYILNNTSAGSTCINETLLQFMHNRLPFGGAGNSGIGKSHGIYGFKAFSNARSVLKSPSRFSPTKLFYPPYTPKVKKMIDWLVRYF